MVAEENMKTKPGVDESIETCKLYKKVTISGMFTNNFFLSYTYMFPTKDLENINWIPSI